MKYLLALCIVVGGIFFFMQHGSTKELVQYAELEKKLAAQADFVLLDVRTQEEYNEGHIPSAVLLPYDRIAAAAAVTLPDKSKEIIVYCRSGRRSAIAAETLGKLGYTKVADFGGISRWKGQLEK